jgi:2-dehydro-3-deoxyphosphooctonate aldolase (KDO 8-P synthase)
MQTIALNGIKIGKNEPLLIISGPCVIEDEQHCLRAAEALLKMCSGRRLNLVFKSSYDKANRSSISSFRGPGLQEGLRILENVKRAFQLPILTDVHSPEEAAAAAAVVDIIQIPAFLCRQTDLVAAVAETGRIVNVKKGQFMAPWDMHNVVEKIRSTGNPNILLTERGTSFGYNNLVSDMRAIPIMQSFGVPVCFDATHSVQLPGGLGKSSGGQREFVAVLAKAALAAGANALFMEAHPDPSKAKSDAASVMPFADLPKLLDEFERLYELVQSW